MRNGGGVVLFIVLFGCMALLTQCMYPWSHLICITYSWSWWTQASPTGRRPRLDEATQKSLAVNSTSRDDGKIYLKFCTKDLCQFKLCYCCQMFNTLEIPCYDTWDDCKAACPPCAPMCAPPPVNSWSKINHYMQRRTPPWFHDLITITSKIMLPFVVALF